MRIEGIEVVVVALSLRAPVHSAELTHSDKTTVFVRVETDTASGWGECSAYPGARAPDPTVVAVEHVAMDQGVRRLFDACPNGTLPPATTVVHACVGTGSPAERSVAAALEMAVLDAELIASSRSLTAALGVTRTDVETGAMVGIPFPRDLARLVDSVGEALETGANRVRVKIEPGWDHVPLEALRERFGDAVLYADANGSYDPGQASVLVALDAYGLRCLEQPFGLAELAAHRDLASVMSTPIGLDESLSSPRHIEAALAARACRVACIKPGRIGGVFAAIAAAAACVAAGVECFVGGFFESGLGRAVNAAVAARGEFELPGDLGDPGRYLDENPFSYLPTGSGGVRLSATRGLGSTVRPDVLRKHIIERRWIPFRL